jgi:hypothetical protein
VDRIPRAPPGILTSTWVDCLNPTVGTNSSVVVPAPCQLPAIAGWTDGSGEPAATRAAKKN